MTNRKLSIGIKCWTLTFDTTDLEEGTLFYEVNGSWEYESYNTLYEHASITISVEDSIYYNYEEDTHHFNHPKIFLNDLKLQIEEEINCDLSHYELSEWIISNDESNYDFYCEL